MRCTSWPDYKYTCTSDGGDKYESLDGSLGRWDTEKCESLCKQKGENGCCYLCWEGCGCYWKKGAAAEKSLYAEIAITCSISGI